MKSINIQQSIRVAAMACIALITAGLIYANGLAEPIVKAPDAVYVDVREGSVQVGRGDEAIVLTAGERGMQERSNAPIVLTDARSVPAPRVDANSVVRDEPKTPSETMEAAESPKGDAVSASGIGGAAQPSAVASAKTALQNGERATVVATVTTLRGEPIGGAVLDLTSDRSSGFHFTAEEKTGADGTACFSDIRLGTYTLGIEHSWYSSAERRDVVVQCKTEEVSIVLPDKNHAISGRVFDAKTKEPIAGAKVVCSLDRVEEYLNYSQWVKTTWRPSILSTTRSVVADGEGFYRFDGLWSGPYIVFVERMEGYISGDVSAIEDVGSKEMQRVSLTETEDVKSVDFYLKEGWKVSGSVYGPDGEPLAGVRLSAILNCANRAAGRFSSRFLAPFGSEAVTDGKGRYEMLGSVELWDDSAVAALYVELRDDRYGRASSEKFYLKPGESKEGVDLHFKPYAVVRGTVCDESGQPIPDARVDIWTLETDGKYYNELNMWRYFQKTDASGSYRFFIDELFGEYHLRANAGGYHHGAQEESVRTVALRAGAEPVECDFKLERGIGDTLEGIVVNEEGEGLPGVELTLKCKRTAIHQNPTAVSQSDGRFAFELDVWDKSWYRDTHPNLNPVGDFLFYISPSNTREYEYIWPKSGDDIPHYTRGTKDIRVVMVRKDRDCVAFRGTVVDARGNPVDRYDIVVVSGNAQETFKRSSRSYRWTPVKSLDGTFSLDDLPIAHAPFYIAVRSEQHGFSCSEILRPEPNEVVEGLTVSFGEGATLKGTALDAVTGKALEGVEVFTMLPPSPKQTLQLTSRLGRAGIHLIPSGQAVLKGDLAVAKTNAKGAFQLERVVVPAVRLRYRCHGYNDYYQSVVGLQHGESRMLDGVKMSLSQ